VVVPEYRTAIVTGQTLHGAGPDRALAVTGDQAAEACREAADIGAAVGGKGGPAASNSMTAPAFAQGMPIMSPAAETAIEPA